MQNVFKRFPCIWSHTAVLFLVLLKNLFSDLWWNVLKRFPSTWSLTAAFFNRHFCSLPSFHRPLNKICQLRLCFLALRLVNPHFCIFIVSPTPAKSIMTTLITPEFDFRAAIQGGILTMVENDWLCGTEWDTCDFMAATGDIMEGVVVLIKLIGPSSTGASTGLGCGGATEIAGTSDTFDDGSCRPSTASVAAGAHLITAGGGFASDAMTVLVINESTGFKIVGVSDLAVDSDFTSDKTDSSSSSESSNRGFFSGG